MNTEKTSYFDKGLIRLKGDDYLNLLIIIAPLMNFLSGISIDLYAPSLPAIANYFDASMMAVKNTITAGMFGFAIGCILFGSLIDAFGRRRILLFSLLLFTIASFLAMFCHNIGELILLRFIQGMMVSAVSIAPRALIMDTFTGHRYNVALLYTSVAYGLGPIIGPFIGGILQYHFGWKANFLAFALFAICLFSIVLLYIDESFSSPKRFTFKDTLTSYISVLKHRTFIAGIMIGGILQFQIMIYPTVGAFIIENILHRTAITYGSTALIMSCGYLAGTLINRLFIKKLGIHQLTHIGFVLLILSSIIQIVFALFGNLNLLALVLPITLIGFSNGFIFSNTLGRCLKLFPQNAGVATAVFACLLMMIGALGVFILSHIHVTSLLILSAIFAVAIFVQAIVFYTNFKNY